MRVGIRWLALLAAWPAWAGYWRGDYNLDGVVDTNDYALWANNVGRTSYVPRAETILTTTLRVTPDRRTVLGGEFYLLGASGSTNTVHWGFVQNPAGGGLSATTGVTVTYLGGGTNSSVDVIQAWDVNNNLARSYFNVIDPIEVASFGKALIVAGGKAANDQVWYATDYVAKRAYNVLRYRGYSSSNINYLSFGDTFTPPAPPDVDGDGQNDVDGPSTLPTVQHAVTNWAAGASSLLVYLADHGSENGDQGYFKLTGSDNLTATNLDLWLDQLQDAYNMDVTVVMEFCYAGTFLNNLGYTGSARRILIAATESGRLTHFLGGGAISFSEMFWGGILQGQDIAGAFAQARSGMSTYQQAVLDADSDGVLDDENTVTGRYVGATFVAGKDIPIIAKVLGNQLLSGGTEAMLWADDIQSYYPLERVWCVIKAPSFVSNTNSGIPELDIPEVDLPYDLGLGRYQDIFDGFAEQGTYTLNFFAQDIWGSISPPKLSAVIQAGLEEGLILVNGLETNDPSFAEVQLMAREVFSGFRVRQLPTHQIQYLSAAPFEDSDGDTTNDVDLAPTWANLVQAFTNGAKSNAVLTVYLIGTLTNAEFRLGASNTLSAASLDGLLDSFQTSNQQVRVVMEFPSASAYLPYLAAPAGRERISIACVQDGQANGVSSDRWRSFTSVFMSWIQQGETIGRAFAASQSAVRNGIRNPRRQLASIDDNGDGLPDAVGGSSTSIRRFFGTAFVTGDDAPQIGKVMPVTPVGGATSVTLWVDNVLDVDGITNVLAIITPPDATSAAGTFRTNLTRHPASNAYYSAQFAGLSAAGNYSVMFVAQDGKGHQSPPALAVLTGPDAYEVDDTAEQATFFSQLGAQDHNFHVSGDHDWARFYFATNVPAVSNSQISIEVYQNGTNVNVALDVYYERADGSLSNYEVNIDFTTNGVGFGEDALISQAFGDPAGYYYVRVRPADTVSWGAESDYELNIDQLTGAGADRLYIIVRNALYKDLVVPGVTVLVNNVNVGMINTLESKVVEIMPSNYTVRVTAAAGYNPIQSTNAAGQVNNPVNQVFGNPRQVTVPSGGVYTEFFFVPEVTASGTAIDAITGEPVGGVKIEFVATSGIYSGLVYQGYPAFATYRTNWFTQPDGNFPTSVILPTLHYNLRLTHPEYAHIYFTNAIKEPEPVPGQHRAFGPLRYFLPVDANGNGIRDGWESNYFGSLTSATLDQDGDGHNNWEEYLAGTVPTNGGSALESTATLTNGQWVLSWTTAPGRVYRVRRTADLTATNWSVVGGEWTATNTQVMAWTSSPPTSATGLYHRVEVLTLQTPP